jgi:protein-S-isoprenylcysteine O-methyltransferase Ste14
METYSPALVRPAAAVVFWALWLVLIGYEAWLIYSPGQHPSTLDIGYPSRVLDRRSRLLVVAGIAVGSALAVTTALKVRMAGLGDGWTGYAVGLCVVVGGLAVRIWSVRPPAPLRPDLPDLASVGLPAAVRTDGPYRLVRHPMYTATLLALAGFGIALDNIVALLAVVVVPLPWIAYRIAIEERALHGMLGSRYAQYRGQTASLIPGVW